MRVADVELERRTAQARAVADALDLQALLEPLCDALDHVRDQRARQPVQRAILAAVGRARHDELVFLALDIDPHRHGLRELAERPVDHDAAGVDRDVHAGRHGNWLSSDAAHYQTKAMTSPPTPRSAAVRSVTRPLEVDRIAVPIPPSTRGRRSLRA